MTVRSAAPVKRGTKKKAKSKAKVRSKRTTSEASVPEAPPAKAERIDVISTIAAQEVAETIEFGPADSIREVIVAELAESMREPNSRAPLMLTRSGIPSKDEDSDSVGTQEDDPFNLDKLVLQRELSPQVIQCLASAVASGSDMASACNRFLIDRYKVSQWNKLGQDVLSGNSEDTSPHAILCMKFVLAIYKANGMYEMNLDAGIHSGNGFMRYLQIAKYRHPALYGETAKESTETFTPNEAYA